jgi:transposase InsO family protein
MCDVLRVSRSGYYSWCLRDTSLREQKKHRVQREIEMIFQGSRQIYGSPRVYEVLKGKGSDVGVDTVARYMREMGLRSKTKKKHRVVTTNSKHAHPVAENLLEQNFTATRPNEIWLSDITYIATGEGWLYLTSFMDLCTRLTVGWNLSTSLAHQGVMSALDMAVKRQNPGPGVIVHSDRGIQYACHEFRQKLEQLHFIQSMSRKGNCYDNAPMESFFHTLKTEFVHHVAFQTIAEAKAALFEWIEIFYNRTRIHSSIGYKTPIAMEESYMLALAS